MSDLKKNTLEKIVKDVEGDNLLPLSPEEQADKAVTNAIKNEAAAVVSQYTELAKAKLNITSKVCRITNELLDDIFSPENLALMDTKSKLFALSINLKALKALSISSEEHQQIVKQINIQINNVLQKDKAIKDIPEESIAKIRDAVSKIIMNSDLLKE